MDMLKSVGKQFLENQQQSQDGHGQGGSSSNQHGGNNSSSRRDSGDEERLHDAPHEASRMAGSSGSSDMFSKIMSGLNQRKDKIADEDIDEEDAERKYKKMYQDDSHGDADSLGVAAAMKALKKFSQGGGEDEERSSKSSGGGQSTLIAMALSEASKLVESKASQGKMPEGTTKESVVQKAGEAAMKMYFKNQAKQQGGVMGLASQFMK
ncbi:hypothetical protein CDD83_5538 [Cordyceps sp. RAO-2017]|nr:hypothetical protein CDD83_5538 [Cordyceps sp. RAO-2017]